ncbi:MAG: alpha/beta hydrolase [Bacteroidota bacterium]
MPIVSIVKGALQIVLLLYLFALVLLYFKQESLLFYPTQLSKTYSYHFPIRFEEKNIEVAAGIFLNALLFKAEKSKGIVLYFHGNGGAIHEWGSGAALFTQNGYDVLYVDYRGYGKSGGSIQNETQLIQDGQVVYDYARSLYPEDQIILSGTSMGTGIAAKLAARNTPKKLLLHAPYYSLKSLVREKVKIVPGFMLKYPFTTHIALSNPTFPVVIFHGDQDQVIPVEHAQKLKARHPKVELHILKRRGHNDMESSPEYVKIMQEVLQ